MTVPAFGQLNYLGPMAERPIAYAHDRSAGNLVFDSRTVSLHDMRALPVGGDIAEAGFLLTEIPVDVPGNGGQDDSRSLHAALLEQLHALTGARKIILSPPSIRGSGRSGAATPAHYIHTDFTRSSFPELIRRVLADDPDRERRLAGHHAIWQTWTALSPPPQDSTLALLNRATLSADDLVEATVVVGDAENRHPHDAHLLRHAPRHRWYHVPEMRRHETILFLGFDSEHALPGSPHSAVRCADTPGATPRISAEMRAFIFWS